IICAASSGRAFLSAITSTVSPTRVRALGDAPSASARVTAARSPARPAASRRELGLCSCAHVACAKTPTASASSHGERRPALLICLSLPKPSPRLCLGLLKSAPSADLLVPHRFPFPDKLN